MQLPIQRSAMLQKSAQVHVTEIKCESAHAICEYPIPSDLKPNCSTGLILLGAGRDARVLAGRQFERTPKRAHRYGGFYDLQSSKYVCTFDLAYPTYVWPFKQS